VSGAERLLRVTCPSCTTGMLRGSLLSSATMPTALGGRALGGVVGAFVEVRSNHLRELSPIGNRCVTTALYARENIAYISSLAAMQIVLSPSPV
jgi:hypothetical protein